jgi:hypothetical protein
MVMPTGMNTAGGGVHDDIFRNGQCCHAVVASFK